MQMNLCVVFTTLPSGDVPPSELRLDEFGSQGTELA
jgi:hypothetical protein